ALVRIRDYDFPIRLTEVTRMFFERSANLVEPELGAAMRGVLQEPPDPESLAYLEALPAYNSRLRTTCVATMLEAGHAYNALPQRARAVVNCRIFPGEAPEAVRRTLEELIADPQVVITVINRATPSAPSPLTAAVID